MAPKQKIDVKEADPRIKALFVCLRQAVDILEDIALHPRVVAQPTIVVTPPIPPPPPPARPDHPMDAMTFKDLRQVVKYSRAHIGRLEKAGNFPKRFNLGPGRVVWWKREVMAWLADRAR